MQASQCLLEVSDHERTRFRCRIRSKLVHHTYISLVPDFRSSTGLFNSVKSQYNLKASGKQLFDASVYRDADSTASFHDMIRTLHQSTKTASPTPFHHLLARLSEEGRLLRLYTQNVDGIDTSLPPLATQIPLPRKGPWPKTVQLHGGLAKMTCTKCNEINDFDPEVFDGPIPPECPECAARDFARTEIAGKRSHGIGRLRPRMVLYHEHNPDDEAIGSVTRADLRTRPDAVIVVGTTLKVPGVRRIVREMCATVRDRRDGFTAWINNDPEPSGKEFEDSWDMIIKGTSDEVARLAALPQWDEPEMAVAVSAAEEAELMCSSQMSVVVPLTPVHTPRHSSQPMARMTPVPSIEMDNWKQGKPAKATPTKPKAAPTKKPAKPATKEKKPAGKKTTTKPPANKKSAPANSTLPFKVSKAAKVVPAGKGKLSDGAATKAEPLAPSSKSNSQFPPEKTGIKVSLKRKQAITAT